MLGQLYTSRGTSHSFEWDKSLFLNGTSNSYQESGRGQVAEKTNLMSPKYKDVPKRIYLQLLTLYVNKQSVQFIIIT